MSKPRVKYSAGGASLVFNLRDVEVHRDVVVRMIAAGVRAPGDPPARARTKTSLLANVKREITRNGTRTYADAGDWSEATGMNDLEKAVEVAEQVVAKLLPELLPTAADLPRNKPRNKTKRA